MIEQMIYIFVLYIVLFFLYFFLAKCISKYFYKIQIYIYSAISLTFICIHLTTLNTYGYIIVHIIASVQALFWFLKRNDKK
jgi:hypothetical protein